MLLLRQMRFILVFVLLGTIVLSGCAANSSDRSRIDRAKNALNLHNYTQAITELEKIYSSDPKNKNAALLLAQAHLGAGGVELFEFINDVFGAQAPDDGLDLVIKPQCDQVEIKKFQGADFRCLALRVLKRLPDSDNSHVVRAKEILRQSFPVASKTNSDVNFLSAFIELGSAFGRLKYLLNRTLVDDIKEKANITPSDLPFEIVIHHLKRFFTEISQGFSRAKYSYGKINKYVVSYEGKPLVKIGDSELVLSEDLSVPTLLRFAIAVLHEKSYETNREINKLIDNNIQSFGHGLTKIVSKLDSVYFADDGSETFETMWKFEGLIKRTIQKAIEMSGESGTANFDIFEIVWQNPPVILKTFGVAARTSWDNEVSEPLRDYFRVTKSRWNELNRLMSEWENWTNNRLSLEQRDGIMKYLSELNRKEPELFKLPLHLTSAEIRAWQNRLANRLQGEITDVLKDKITGIPKLTPIARNEGFVLLSQTMEWIDQNLWPLQ